MHFYSVRVENLSPPSDPDVQRKTNSGAAGDGAMVGVYLGLGSAVLVEKLNECSIGEGAVLGQDVVGP